jgi:hypothetical protein
MAKKPYQGTNDVWYRGEYAVVPVVGGYQVVNTRTARRSTPKTKIRALRLLIKVTR